MARSHSVYFYRYFIKSEEKKKNDSKYVNNIKIVSYLEIKILLK